MADLMTLRRNIIASKAEKPVAKVYGVEWNYADPSTVLKRTGDAANFANPIPAESLSEIGWSPFDNVYPWSEMKRYNIINGEVAYSEDDTGYSETLYDTMVYIPEFYYYAYKDTANKKWYWNISAKPLEGYEKHPGSGRYVGRFLTSGSSDGVFSKSDATPMTNTTISQYRSYSHNKGNNWWQIDIATMSAIQLLYIVEFANWNSQNVLGYGQNSSVENTGRSTGSAYHTIKRSGATNTYRWFENPFSNMSYFIDGYLSNNRTVYITTNLANNNGSIDNMDNTNIQLPNTAGYITNFAYLNNYRWAFIPNEVNNKLAGNTYITDVIYIALRGLCVPFVGGGASNNENYGLFYTNIQNSASITGTQLSSRLMFIPST